MKLRRLSTGEKWERLRRSVLALHSYERDNQLASYASKGAMGAYWRVLEEMRVLSEARRPPRRRGGTK